MKKQNIIKRLCIWVLFITAILLVPLLFQAPWTGMDFVFAGVVLFGSAVVYEVVTRTMSNKNHRIVVALAVITVVFLIWGWAVA